MRTRPFFCPSLASSWNQISTRLVLGRPARWAASVRGKFFERLDHPLVLLGVLRPGADVGEGQRDEKVGDRPLAIDHAKAFFDHPFQVNPPPANHTVNLWIGARFDDHRQFAHLLVGQEPGAARTGTVLQAVCPFIVEAVRPVSQRLAIHAADLSGFRSAHAVVNRRQGKSRRTWRGSRLCLAKHRSSMLS